MAVAISPMFTINDRDRVRDHVLKMARSDSRVVAGAVVGSLARGDGDRLSDLDLTFGVVDTVPIRDVLEDFTIELVDQFEAVHLFGRLSTGSVLYATMPSASRAVAVVIERTAVEGLTIFRLLCSNSPWPP